MRLRRPRLTLGAMMVLVLAVGGWLGWIVHRVRVQREAVAAIRAAKGNFSFDWQYRDGQYRRDAAGPRAPAWLRRLVGDEPFQSISRVDLSNGSPSDAVLAALASQGRIESLDLNLERGKLSEAGFASLGRLTGLRDLWLYGRRVDDLAMAHVGRLSGLRHLQLDGTSVGDAGLARLRGLRQLELLRLDESRVTDSGMAHVAALPRLRVLGFPYTRVGDAGLDHLRGLPLVEVMLYECPATPSGVARLAASLPKAAEILGP